MLDTYRAPLGAGQNEDFCPADFGKLICATCGMVANVDPEFHRERYAHAPTIRTASQALYVWNGWDFARQTIPFSLAPGHTARECRNGCANHQTPDQEL